MSEIYESHNQQVRYYTEKFSLSENQKGIMMMINEQIIGLEIFDSSKSLGKYFNKLIQSYTLDAIDLAGQRQTTDLKLAPKAWIEEISELLQMGLRLHYVVLNKRFRDLGFDAHLVLTLHDEIVVGARDELVDQVSEVVAECLKEAFMGIIPRMPFKLKIRIADA